MSAPVCILISDPYPITLHALESLLEGQPGWRVVGTARDGAETYARCVELRPDLLLVDAAIPGPELGLVVREVMRACPQTRILAFSAQDDPATIAALREAGGAGYVSKREPLDTLLRAIQTVVAGFTWFPPPHPAEGTAEPSPLAREAGMTARQALVVKALRTGKTNEGIAGELGVSPRTVARDVRSLCDGLGLASRTELVAWAVNQGRR